MNVSIGTTSVKPRLRSENDSGSALDMMYVVLVYSFLEDKGFRFNNPCVGVLLRPDLVLTTLSCLEVSVHGAIDTEVVFVYARNSQVLRSVRVFVYPDTKEGPDVALILCESSRVDAFPRLPEKEFLVSEFEYCTLCGFGSERNRLKMEDFTKVRLNRSDMEVCNRFGKGEDWLCLHFRNTIPCRGDVGAPLVCDGAVHAIFNPTVVPWGPPSCTDAYGATFSPLYSVVPWIRRVNDSLETPVLDVMNTPWYWVCVGVSALTIIVVIYYGIMRYVEWLCARDETSEEQTTSTRRRPDTDEEANESRVIYVKSSHTSWVSNRWLWQR